MIVKATGIHTGRYIESILENSPTRITNVICTANISFPEIKSGDNKAVIYMMLEEKADIDEEQNETKYFIIEMNIKITMFNKLLTK
eukprot:GAHX01001114.1.p1 GENE.GAHX01001114.1~~GAHX01001114.1.p1  ORF type:complete len:86 (+),score=19.22 GAHX01001114.1:255-512(+)